MKKTGKIILTFTVLATFWLTYWLFMFFVSGAREIPVISLFTSVLIATGIGFLTWKSLKKRAASFSRYVLKGGLVIGTVLFLAGFVGPILFWTSSNMGPVLGLFFTGPIGFLLGLLGGGIYWQFIMRKKIDHREN